MSINIFISPVIANLKAIKLYLENTWLKIQNNKLAIKAYNSTERFNNYLSSFDSQKPKYTDNKFLFSILAILLFVFAIDLPLLSGLLSRNQLANSIGDEFLFFSQIEILQTAISSSNWDEFLNFGFVAGYGSVFWTIYTLVSLPFKNGDYETQILALRIFSTLLKSFSFCLLFATFYKRSFLYALLSVTLLLSFPAFYMYGKVISTIYLQMFFFSLSLFFLLKDNDSSLKNFLYSSTFALIAVFTKISSAPFLLAWVLIALFKYRRQLTMRILVKYSLLATIVALICNLTILGYEGIAKTIRTFSVLATWTVSNSVKNFYILNNMTWDGIISEGIKYGYLNIYGLFFICLLTIIGIYKSKNIKNFLLFAVCALSIYITTSTLGSASWYIIIPAFIFLYIAISSASYLKYKNIFLLILVIYSIFMNYSFIEYKINHRKAINNLVLKNEQSSREIYEYLEERNLAKGHILSDHFLAFPSDTVMNKKELYPYGIWRFQRDKTAEELKIFDWVLLYNNEDLGVMLKETEVSNFLIDHKKDIDDTKKPTFVKFKEFDDIILYRNIAALE